MLLYNTHSDHNKFRMIGIIADTAADHDMIADITMHFCATDKVIQLYPE